MLTVGVTKGPDLPSSGLADLFDLPLVVAPDGGLAGPDRPDVSLDAGQLAGLVRRAGGEGLDVRVLAPTGEQHLPTLTALADLLGCDVLAARAVDPATGYRMDWVTISPAGQVGALPGWFDTAHGRVVPRTGTVALPLAGGGLMLATRRDFTRRRALAAALRSGHPELLTVGAPVRSGDFVVGDYGGRTSIRDGRGLAVALAGLALYGAALRMWLTWPEPAGERRRLAGNLTALADVTGATVWAPAEGGRAELAEDSRELRAVRADGETDGWQAYGAVGPADFRSDVDGRLVPAGGPVVIRYPGVPVVSVPPARERAMAERYTDLPPSREVFRVDLAVLADGRLAVRYADGSLLAVSGGQLRQLLRDAGWQGAPVALLSTVSREQAAAAHRHAAELARQLGGPVTFVDPAHRKFPGPQGAPAGPLDARTGRLSRFIDGPRLEPAGRSAPPHGIAWLPPAPQTNSESFDVFVECAVDPERALAQGVPSAQLFLLGHLGRDRLAARTSAGHLLQVRVGAQGAVDVGACEVAVPRSLAGPLSGSDVYLLPVAWLARCRVVAAIRVDRAGPPSPHRFPEPRPLLVRCAGADHGVPGLPTEAVRWPRGWRRAPVTRFASVPDDADGPVPWLPLHRHRPAPADGRRIVQLRVHRGSALDVAATATDLARLAGLRGAAGELVAAGVDVLLPVVSYPHTTVLRAFRGDGSGWRRVPVPRGTRLDAWLAGGE